jgi:exonuclease SbcD
MSQAYVVKTPMLPSSPQYIALGHIHMPQEFPLANAHYCGSLLQCDFGEAGQKKRVNIVDVKPGAKAKVEHIPLSSIKQLRNVGSHEEGVTLDEIKALAPRESGLASDIGEDYLKVFLKLDAPVPGLAEQVHELLPNAVDIVVQRNQDDDSVANVDLSKESPTELFRTYYKGAHGSEPGKELMALFSTLYEEATAAPD